MSYSFFEFLCVRRVWSPHKKSSQKNPWRVGFFAISKAPPKLPPGKQKNMSYQVLEEEIERPQKLS